MGAQKYGVYSKIERFFKFRIQQNKVVGEKMQIKCGKCNSELPLTKKPEELPLFNVARRHSWHHEICSNCGSQIDIARFNKKGKLWAIQG